MCEKVNAIINASAEDKKKFLTKVVLESGANSQIVPDVNDQFQPT